MTGDVPNRVLERLIEALAAQVASSPVPALAVGAAQALAGLGRAEVALIFGTVGHLAHYGTERTSLETLARLITEGQRLEEAGGATLLPGDEVQLVGELPPRMAGYSAEMRESTFVVRYVGEDSTIDLQPAWTDDYVFETVPAAIVRRVR